MREYWPSPVFWIITHSPPYNKPSFWYGTTRNIRLAKTSKWKLLSMQTCNTFGSHLMNTTPNYMHIPTFLGDMFDLYGYICPLYVFVNINIWIRIWMCVWFFKIVWISQVLSFPNSPIYEYTGVCTIYQRTLHQGFLHGMKNK